MYIRVRERLYSGRTLNKSISALRNAAGVLRFHPIFMQYTHITFPATINSVKGGMYEYNVRLI